MLPTSRNAGKTTSDKKPITSMKKRHFTILAIILTILFMATFFTPTYQVTVGEGETAYGYMDTPWNAFPKLQGNLPITSTVFLVLEMALLLASIVMYLISATTKNKESDKEDKFFVFASFLAAISNAFYAVMCVGVGSFIPMLLAILYAIIYVIGILIHNKFLTEY